MAFETGIPATTEILLQNTVAFAVANAGFTEVTKVTTGLPADNTTDMYILEKGGIYWWLLGMQRSDADFGTYGEIDCRMMLTTPTAGNMLTLSLGAYERTRVSTLNRPSGPFSNYWLYSATGDAVSLVVEITPGVFTHLSFGDVTKFGTWTGGQFLTAETLNMGPAYTVANGFADDWGSVIVSYSNMAFDHGYHGSYIPSGYHGFVYNPVNSYGDQRDFAPINNSTSASAPYYSQRARFEGVYHHSTSGSSLLQYPMTRSPNAFNGRAALFPTYLLLYDPILQKDVLSGHVEGVRHVRITDITPKETVEVDWDIYPHRQKSGDKFVSPISNHFGLAYRRVV